MREYHSNDKYRTIAWCCNQKYAGEKVCATPRIREEDLRSSYALALGQVLARLAATEGLGAPDGVEDGAERQHLEKAQEAANLGLQAAARELKALLDDNARRSQDQTIFQQKYATLSEKVTTHQKAVESAKNALLDYTAQKEKRRRFREATKDLDPEDITLTDELITATCEKITVGKRTDEGFQLTFYFTDGSWAEMKVKANS